MNNNKKLNTKQIKRNFLIRLMTMLGFGGMAAFCLSSCQSTTGAGDKQPKQESESTMSSDTSAPVSDSQNADPDDQENLPKAEFNENNIDNFFPPQTEPQMPVKKYGIVTPIPTDDIDDVKEPLIPEETEESLMNKPNNNNQKPDVITTKYGIRKY